MAQAAFDHARIAHAEQELESAWDAACRAVQSAPDHPAAAFLKAQIAFESWRPSVDLFENALRLDRDNPRLLRSFIQALAAEGQSDRADAILCGIIARQPDWRDGHAQLATIRLTRGDTDPFRSYRDARNNCSKLGLDWFNRLATCKDWDGAEAVLADLEARCPDWVDLKKARLFLDCESGKASNDLSLFQSFAGHSDPGIALIELRHALRHGDPEKAESIAANWTSTQFAAQFWPYRDLAWRLNGDPRHGWLHGDPPFLAMSQIVLEPGFDAFIRSLHHLQAPYPEQSVHGGTQTARNLLMHHSPVMAGLRDRLTVAVQEWRDGLPQGDGSHPLLDRKPAVIRFQGSWSVRLAARGYHRPHTHPAGWASSALYIAVAEDEDAGAFALGMPPQELRLGLEPERLIEPAEGRLILFPSTCWHATVPCAGAERLSIAFDIEPAGAERDNHA